MLCAVWLFIMYFLLAVSLVRKLLSRTCFLCGRRRLCKNKSLSALAILPPVREKVTSLSWPKFFRLNWLFCSASVHKLRDPNPNKEPLKLVGRPRSRMPPNWHAAARITVSSWRSQQVCLAHSGAYHSVRWECNSASFSPVASTWMTCM